MKKLLCAWMMFGHVTLAMGGACDQSFKIDARSEDTFALFVKGGAMPVLACWQAQELRSQIRQIQSYDDPSGFRFDQLIANAQNLRSEAEAIRKTIDTAPNDWTILQASDNLRRAWWGKFAGLTTVLATSELLMATVPPPYGQIAAGVVVLGGVAYNTYEVAKSAQELSTALQDQEDRAKRVLGSDVRGFIPNSNAVAQLRSELSQLDQDLCTAIVTHCLSEDEQRRAFASMDAEEGTSLAAQMIQESQATALAETQAQIADKAQSDLLEATGIEHLIDSTQDGVNAAFVANTFTILADAQNRYYEGRAQLIGQFAKSHDASMNALADAVLANVVSELPKPDTRTAVRNSALVSREKREAIQARIRSLVDDEGELESMVASLADDLNANRVVQEAINHEDFLTTLSTELKSRRDLSLTQMQQAAPSDLHKRLEEAATQHVAFVAAARTGLSELSQLADVAPAQAEQLIASVRQFSPDAIQAQFDAQFEAQLKAQSTALIDGIKDTFDLESQMQNALSEMGLSPEMLGDVGGSITELVSGFSPEKLMGGAESVFQSAPGLSMAAVSIAGVAFTEFRARKRHNEVMAALRAITAELVKINKTLEEIQRLQAQMAESLQNIERELAAMRQEQRHQFDDLRAHIALVHRLIRGEATRGFCNCYDFLRDPASDFVLNSLDGRVPPAHCLAKRLEQRRNDWERCDAAISQTRDLTGPAEIFTRAQWIQNTLDSSGPVRANDPTALAAAFYHQNLINTQNQLMRLSRCFAPESDANPIHAMLAKPVATLAQVDESLAEHLNVAPSEVAERLLGCSLLDSLAAWQRAVQEQESDDPPLEPSMVLMYAFLVGNLHYYPDAMTSTEARERIRQALTLLGESSRQGAVEFGDSALPIIAGMIEARARWERERTKDEGQLEESRTIALRALEATFLLQADDQRGGRDFARNLGAYLVRNSFGSYSSYAAAIRAGTGKYCVPCIQAALERSSLASGWTVVSTAEEDWTNGHGDHRDPDKTLGQRCAQYLSVEPTMSEVKAPERVATLCLVKRYQPTRAQHHTLQVLDQTSEPEAERFAVLPLPDPRDHQTAQYWESAAQLGMRYTAEWLVKQWAKVEMREVESPLVRNADELARILSREEQTTDEMCLEQDGGYMDLDSASVQAGTILEAVGTYEFCR